MALKWFFDFYLLLHVDDMLIATKRMFNIMSLKTQLSAKSDMKDLGAAKIIVGMEIHWDRQTGKLYLPQKKYTEKVLEIFGMSSSKPVNTAPATHFKLSAALSSQAEVDVEQISRGLIENHSMMYGMVCPGLDISQAMYVVSQ